MWMSRFRCRRRRRRHRPSLAAGSDSFRSCPWKHQMYI
jgi:hypothetical protein